jgi:hypothetical protein
VSGGTGSSSFVLVFAWAFGPSHRPAEVQQLLSYDTAQDGPFGTVLRRFRLVPSYRSKVPLPGEVVSPEWLL